MRTLTRVALLLILLLIAGAFGKIWLNREIASPTDSTQSVSVHVASGVSLRSVLTDLANKGALRWPRLVEWYARYTFPGLARAQAGDYEIAPHSSGLQILQQLREGRVVLQQFTIIEGWTFAQMRASLAVNPALGHVWAALTDSQIMSELGAPGVHPEGQFFPDSYRFAADTPDSRIYQLAYRRMQLELDAAWKKHVPGVPVHTPQQLLILASVIEKETGREDERGLVAAVFTNRLRVGMKLQSDPTVIYGLGSAYDGDLRSRDLVNDTPYNSYTRYGLPPTPIALPGSAALLAAAQPASSAALYFVATGNGDGSHHFSSTLAEHNNAVRRFLARTRRKD